MTIEGELTDWSSEELFAGLFGPAGHEDPYPFYRELHSHGTLRTLFGTLVFGYADCQQVMQSRHGRHDPDMSLPARGIVEWKTHPSLRLAYQSMLTRNPPEHDRLRSLVGKAFTRRETERLIPAIERLADGIVQQMIDQVAGAPEDSLDLIAACAYQLPVAVIGELLGVPVADRPQFQQLMLAQTAVLEMLLDDDTIRQADIAAEKINDYFEGLIRDRRAHPRDDLTSKLVAVEDDGDRLTHEELLQTLALIMGAGFETTTNLIANGVAALLANPTQLAMWRADPDLTDNAVEELLRYDSPTQLLARALNTDLLLPSGATLKQGEMAILMIGAGNRDPRRYSNPDQLNLNRPEPHPLSFGGGIHHCLGAPLARAEARILFPRLLKAFPAWESAPGATRRQGLTIRGFTHLPLRLTIK